MMESSAHGVPVGRWARLATPRLMPRLYHLQFLNVITKLEIIVKLYHAETFLQLICVQLLLACMKIDVFGAAAPWASVHAILYMMLQTFQIILLVLILPLSLGVKNRNRLVRASPLLPCKVSTAPIATMKPLDMVVSRKLSPLLFLAINAPSRKLMVYVALNKCVFIYL
jgi:hypothetical protein